MNQIPNPIPKRTEPPQAWETLAAGDHGLLEDMSSLPTERAPLSPDLKRRVRAAGILSMDGLPDLSVFEIESFLQKRSAQRNPR